MPFSTFYFFKVVVLQLAGRGRGGPIWRQGAFFLGSETSFLNSGCSGQVPEIATSGGKELIFPCSQITFFEFFLEVDASSPTLLELKSCSTTLGSSHTDEDVSVLLGAALCFECTLMLDLFLPLTVRCCSTFPHDLICFCSGHVVLFKNRRTFVCILNAKRLV